MHFNNKVNVKQLFHPGVGGLIIRELFLLVIRIKTFY